MNYDTATFDEIWEYESKNYQIENWSKLLMTENGSPEFLKNQSTGKFMDINPDYKIIFYLENGKLHRTNGPAIIYKNNDIFSDCIGWHNNGKLHRTDGPAIIRYSCSANKDYNWYLYGKLITQEKFNFITNNNLENGNEIILL